MDPFQMVKGQEHVKRALEVALVGGHSILLMGPAGTGKTLLAQGLAQLAGALVIDDVPDLPHPELLALRR